ncbi:hypothetical protein JTB14_026715 [Gonioctena quinquepunctata]|nr:hypothetical protein JTB14_026715 [Gonioctena quinquepunctata]
MYRTIILFLLFTNLLGKSNDCDNKEIQKLCMDQEKCDECLQADPCCSWCYDEKYHGRRCNVTLQTCDTNKMEFNSHVNVSTADDGFAEFSEITEKTNMEEIIQIKPQHIHVKLRKGIPVNFTFTYKPAANYPLDLYYLGDLSASMEANMKIFKTIGLDLSKNLTQLTKNYKLAYGSFMDKTDMPFYFTDPENSNNPCLNLLKTCEKGYLFRHRLDFSSDVDTFSKKISSSMITANVDDLDGALDAILQILLCERKIGWSKFSRKIILLPTDSLLHMAGDGILVGAVMKPTDKCMLDGKGEHTEPLKYDYPSIELIEMLLRQKKVNIIFAVKTKSKLDYYTKLSKTLLKDYGYVVELEADSKNILNVIAEGFFNFAQQVSFYINTTQHPHIDVQFFADCDNNDRFNETSTCYGVKDKPVDFKVQLTLKENPMDLDEDQLFVEEKNINEKLALSVTYLGRCKCKNYQDNGEVCEHGGNRKCGECYCPGGWTGKNCEESCDDNDAKSCRLFVNNTYSDICSDRGYCECGKCVCNPPYEGGFCEYQCPSDGEKICSGPTQGKCIMGKCICERGFAGETCSCSTSTDDCMLGNAPICSEKGKCECNQCMCNEGFSGKFCEINQENNTICEKYDSFVEGWYAKADGVQNHTLKENTTIVLDELEHPESFSCGESCSIIIFDGNSRCDVQYCYLEKDGVVHLPAKKICYMTAGFMGTISAAGIIAAILLGGILMIAFIKWKHNRDDRIEYERFMQQKSIFNELNPVYKDPVTRYNNPLRNKRN